MTFYQEQPTVSILKILFIFKDPVTGLLPPTGGQRKFGLRDYPGDAWVRDNVYGSLSMWSLALAYGKNADHDDEKAKAFELKQVSFLRMSFPGSARYHMKILQF